MHPKLISAVADEIARERSTRRIDRPVARRTRAERRAAFHRWAW